MINLKMFEIQGGTVADIEQLLSRIKLYRSSDVPPHISSIINTELGYIIRYYSTHDLTCNSITPNDVVFEIQDCVPV